MFASSTLATLIFDSSDDEIWLILVDLSELYQFASTSFTEIYTANSLGIFICNLFYDLYQK